MDRLKTLATLVCLGAGGVLPGNARADGQPAPAPRPAPPSPPLKYLEAGARLFNKARFDEAGKYLAAAHTYRDQLTPNQQVVLDVYREELERYRLSLKPTNIPPPRVAAAPGPTTDPSVQTTSAVITGLPPLPSPRPTTQLAPTMGPGAGMGTEAWRDTADQKQKARWLVQQARSQIFHGQFDAAAESLAEAQTLDVTWGRFDDTPAKVAEILNQARLRAPLANTPDTGAAGPHDRRAAQALLRAARKAVTAGNFDNADAIVREIQSWKLRYGLFDDTPEKVAVLIAAGRHQVDTKDAGLMEGMIPQVQDQRLDPSTPR